MVNRKIILLLIAVMVILVGCKSDEPDSANEVASEKFPEEAGEAQDSEQPEQEKLSPLTGNKGSTNVNVRPVAVMLNNDVKARPQSGLHKADVVYEVLAEGDITRLLAIYQSEMPEIVGPVRSARDYFVDLTKGYDALFVFHGWSPDARVKIEAKEVDGINGLFYDGTLFKRASFRQAPHNSYITSGNIEKGANQLNYNLEADITDLSFLKEGETSEARGVPTEYVKLAYSSRVATHVEYKYDEENNHYVRYSGREKNFDLETSEEIIAHNIFIVETSHTVIDDVGRREIDLISGGQGILIQNGVSHEVEWKAMDGRILPYHDNQPVPFTPGKTWIQVIPDLNKVSF